MMAVVAAMTMARQHTDKWNGNDLLMMMISLMASMMTNNKKYDEGG